MMFIYNKIYKLVYNLAVKLVIRELKFEKDKDNSMFHTWQSCIAMSFKDRYHEAMRNRNLPLDNGEIHKVANNAAKDFLNILINEG